MEERHLSGAEVEGFVNETLPEPELEPVEIHLLICECCRQRVERIDRFLAELRAAGVAPETPLQALHITSDGPVTLHTRKSEGGHWIAVLSAPETRAEKSFEDLDAAKVFLARVFTTLFPEHLCDSRCGKAPHRLE